MVVFFVYLFSLHRESQGKFSVILQAKQHFQHNLHGNPISKAVGLFLVGR